MTVGPDLGPSTLLPDERIVGRHFSVVEDSVDGPVVVGDVLRRMGREVAGRRHHPVADRDEQEAVLVEREPGSEVPGRPLGHRHEDVLHSGQAVVFETAPGHGRRGGRAVPTSGFRVAQVKEVVGREVRVKGDVEEPALAPRDDFGNSLDRCREELALADDSKPPRPLGDEHVPAGKEGDRPGIHQPVDHRHDPEIVLGRTENVGLPEGRASHERGPRRGPECSPNHCHLLENAGNVVCPEAGVIPGPRPLSGPGRG